MSNVSFLNSQIEQYQKMWILANQRGDKQAMAQAHQQAEALRQQGGTTRADQDTPATLALKQAVQTAGVHVTITNYSVQELNRGIVQAKQDYLYAQARGDHAAMQAASTLANNYRALGGTITASATMTEARNPVLSSATNSINRSPAFTVEMMSLTGVPGNLARAFPQHDGSIVGTDDSGNQTVYVPPTHPNTDLQNDEVENDKLNYINAQFRGDQQGMNNASSDAIYRRDLGATLGSGDDTAGTKALKNYYSNDPIIQAAVTSKATDALNQAIWKAKNDYVYAQEHNDQAGMKAAAALAANMRAMGGTIGADVSLQQAHDMVFGTSNKTSSTSSTPASTEPDPSQTALNNVWGVVQNLLGVDEIRNAWNTLIDPNSTPTQQASAAATITLNIGMDGLTLVGGIGEAAKAGQLLIKGARLYGKDLLEQTAEKEAAVSVEGTTGQTEGADATKGTGETYQLSSNSLKHVWNGHSYDSFNSQLPYLLKAKSPQEVENILSETSFFNKDLTKQQVGSIVEKATGEALSQGITNGTYSTTVEGQRVTVAMDHGQFQTAYGDYHYTLSDFGY